MASPNDSQLSDKETSQRMTAALQRALNTPHAKHAPLKAKHEKDDPDKGPPRKPKSRVSA